MIRVFIDGDNIVVRDSEGGGFVGRLELTDRLNIFDGETHEPIAVISHDGWG
jgi:hypothetical protein